VAAATFPPRSAAGQAAAPPVPAAREADSLFRAGDFARALPAYEALARRAPRNTGYWARVGLSAANLGNYQRGLEAFQQAVAIDSNATSMYNVGAMHARLNHPDQAIAWVDRAVTRGFRALHVLQSDDDFAAVRNRPQYAAVVARLERLLSPCADNEDSHRFDFWIGDWEVRTVQGAVAGRNVIERVSGGCALLENWTDAGGRTGKSLNAFNRALAQWQQFWVGQGGEVTEYRESRWDGASLVFFNRTSGDSVVRRLTFTPVTRDHVRQHGEISRDGGVAWSTQYDLQYHRVK
jgi:tetratricopeptide (TPR) repeat protein